MNRLRRKALHSIMSQLEELQAVLEDLMEDEEEARDNIPESLWESERYEKADEACGNLSNALSSLEDALDSIEAAAE